MYLLCRLQRLRPDTEVERQIENLESILLDDESVCREDAEAVGSLYALWRKEPEKLTGWLNDTGSIPDAAVTEDNFNIFYCKAKGYLFLNQYERACKILKRMTPYLQSGRHHRFLAEVLFELAIFHCNMGHRGIACATRRVLCCQWKQPLCGNSTRSTGRKRKQVLEIYVDWRKEQLPRLPRQKKYIMEMCCGCRRQIYWK